MTADQFTAGQRLTAAALNTALSTVETEASASGSRAGSQATTNTNQTLTTGTVVALSLCENLYNDGLHSTTTNPTRFTASATARYLFNARVAVTHTSNTSGLLALYLRKDGTTIIHASAARIRGGSRSVFEFCTIIELAAASYIELLLDNPLANTITSGHIEDADWGLGYSASSVATLEMLHTIASLGIGASDDCS